MLPNGSKITVVRLNARHGGAVVILEFYRCLFRLGGGARIDLEEERGRVLVDLVGHRVVQCR